MKLALLLLLMTFATGCGTIRGLTPCEKAYQQALENQRVREANNLGHFWNRPKKSDYCP